MKLIDEKQPRMHSLSLFSAALAVSGMTVASPLSARDLVTCPRPDPDHLNLVPDAANATISISTSPPETWEMQPQLDDCIISTTQTREQLDDAIQEATLHPCDQKIQVPYNNANAVAPGIVPRLSLLVESVEATRRVPTYANLLQIMTLAKRQLSETETSHCMEFAQYFESPALNALFTVS